MSRISVDRDTNSPVCRSTIPYSTSMPTVDFSELLNPHANAIAASASGHPEASPSGDASSR